MLNWRINFLLMILVGYDVFISTGRRAAESSVLLVWSDPPSEGSPERESCYLSVKNPVSVTSARMEYVDWYWVARRTHTYAAWCAQNMWLEVQQEQNLHVKPPQLLRDWQPMRKAAMFHGRVSERPLLCRPSSRCSVGEKAAQTDGWDSFDYATD